MMSNTTQEPVAIVCDLPSNTSISGKQIEVAHRDALPFRHVKYIGHGSSAVIEMVSHKSTNEVFALKSFRRFYDWRFGVLKSAFDNEVSIMERLSSHRHIIKIQSTFICDRQIGMLLYPVASDGDLGAYFARIFDNGLANNEHIVTLNRAFGCLASGLSHIHKHTIRHKDIKPQNILIHDGRVIYTDFGISFDADQQETTTIGYPGACTRRYCAPEVQDNTKRNRKSDVYSLGCVFVEILDVLEPEIGFRYMDRLPYFEKLDEIRKRLLEANGAASTKKELFLICHDMLDPNLDDRIDTASVLSRITTLAMSKSNDEVGLFCDDCLDSADSKNTDNQKELVGEVPVSLSNTASTDITSSKADVETPIHENKEHQKKEPVVRNNKTGSLNSVHSVFPRYYCTTCGELGHTSSRCANKCWACDELYHKSAQCPNKCWECGSVGHYARDCPIECDACGKKGHSKDDCPNRCWTCGDVGHFARDCKDECFVCGRLGHGTQKCIGKCHKCGKIGHWKRDCGDACFECGKLGHWADKCPSKKGKHGNSCFRCGDSSHMVAECPKKKRTWRPIFDQVPQGPYRPEPRRRGHD